MEITAAPRSPLSPAWEAFPGADSNAELPGQASIPQQMWTRHDAAHLVRRMRLGASQKDIDQAFAAGPAATIDRYLTVQAESPEFLAREAALFTLANRSGDIADLRAWWAHRLLDSANPLVEKMVLFWHGHFATSNGKVRSLPQMAAQNALFRHHALGSFRDLLHEITRDVAMLVWLDGNANRKRQPNENFARELMELFALGIGNYTELDIQEAARAFSGWHVRKGQFWLSRIQLDTTAKTVFGKTGNFDGDDIVELCLEQDAAPRFLATKLLQFFVMPMPTDKTVRELAACIREHNFALRPVLRRLFSSSIFFSAAARVSLIKSPAEFVLGTQRTLEATVNLRESVHVMGQLGQSLFEPPTVEGWKGGRSWINSATVLGRANFAAELAMGNRFGAIADPAQTAARLGWQEPHEAVTYYIELLLAREVPSAQSAIASYLARASGPLGDRLRGVLHLLLTLPDYQLI
jgi:uncharacterized protein (DUF1800 family)